MRFTALLGLCLGSLMGCATYHDDLERGQHYYEVSQYPNALAIWRTLEIDLDSFSSPEQAQYAYLRGMTDYRMGYRADARHWLAVARAIEQKHPGGLDAKSIAEMERALGELNAAVYAMGPPPSAVATGIELTNVTPASPPPAAGPYSVQAQAPMQVQPPTETAPAVKPVAPSPTPNVAPPTGNAPSSVPPPSGV